MEFLALLFFILGPIIGITGVVDMKITKDPSRWTYYNLFMWMFIGLGWITKIAIGAGV